MSLLASSIFCVIFALTVQIDISLSEFQLGCEYTGLEFWVPEVEKSSSSKSSKSKKAKTTVTTEKIVEPAIAIFGDDIMPAVIADEKTLNDTLQQMEKILIGVVSEVPYNTFDDFAKFYLHKYLLSKARKFKKKNITSDDFKTLFEEYKPKFSEDTGRVGLVFQVLKKISQKFMYFKDNVYIATAYDAVPDKFVRDQQAYDDIDTKFFVNNHIVGVFQYKLNNKVGYVLLDPVKGYVKPIHVKEDQTQFTGYDTDLGSLRFKMLPYFQNGVPVYSSPYMIQGEKENARDGNILYYIKRPFCSAMTVTAKRDLLSPTRLIEKRDNQGRTLALLSIKLLPIVQTPIVTLQDSALVVKATFKTLEFTSGSSRHNVKKEIDAVLPNMGYQVFEALSEIVSPVAAASRNPTFLCLYNRLIFDKLNLVYDGSVLEIDH